MTTTVKLRTMAFIAFAAFALTGCRTSQHATPEEPPSVALPVAVAVAAPLSAGETASGTVVAEHRVQLAARTSGTVRAPGLHEGQSVRQGEVLGVIDARQADGTVHRARAALEAALAEQSNADGDVARYTPLASAGIVARDAFLRVQLRASVAATAVEQARAALAIAEADRSYNKITSPVDGVVVARHVRDGDIAMAGTPLVTVEGRRDLLFRFAAPQGSLSAFEPGTRVPVLIDGREDRAIEGKVRAVVPSADPATRRYTVEISLPPDDTLLAGMFGRVRLPATARGSGSAVSVPASALAERGGLTGVFVVGEDERLHFRWLRLTEKAGDAVLVVAGLSEGEKVLARVEPSVRDGARLLPMEPAK